MSKFPDDRRYAKSHEWVLVENELATVGVTDFAQQELGEVVYVDLSLSNVGEVFDAGDEFGSIESVKAVSELYLPIAGEVVQHNPNLENDPGVVNEDPHGEGWLLKLKVASDADLGSLMSAEEYETYLAEEAKAH